MHVKSVIQLGFYHKFGFNKRRLQYSADLTNLLNMFSIPMLLNLNSNFITDLVIFYTLFLFRVCLTAAVTQLCMTTVTELYRYLHI